MKRANEPRAHDEPDGETEIAPASPGDIGSLGQPMLDDFLADIVAVESIEAVPTILEVVCRTTGMGFAAVARVTEDRWIACSVKDDIAFGLKPGGELSVETTICHGIRQSSAAVVIDHVSEDPKYRGHPTPAMHGFQSYISMPILLRKGSLFGTLCAIDPRPAKVNTPEIIGMFKMFAELIGFHLDANQRVKTSTAALRLYENIVQSDTASICVFDTEFRLIAFNEAHNAEFHRVNGFDTKLGDVFPDLFIPEQAAMMRKLMGPVLAGEAFPRALCPAQLRLHVRIGVEAVEQRDEFVDTLSAWTASSSGSTRFGLNWRI